MIAELSNRVESLTYQVRNQGNSSERGRTSGGDRRRSPNQSPNRNWRRSPSNQRSKYNDHDPEGPCFYHYKYGVKAHKCVPPCSYTKDKTPTKSSNNKASD